MKTILMSGIAAAAVLLSPPAVAQGANCAPREMVVERLAQKYGETRRSVGLAPNNAVVEVFASEETGSWTITITSVQGLTCLVAAGQAYEALAEALPAAGSDA